METSRIIPDTTPKLPTGLLTAALFFWAWRTDLWLFAVPMALILESSPWMTWRWALSDKEMARAVDLCSLPWIVAIILLFTRYMNQPPLATHLYTLASWFPLLLFLPLTIQRYSTVGVFRFGHLFYSLRHSTHPLAQQPISLDVLYFIICLLAASVTSQPHYLIGASVLVFWVLIAMRPQRYRGLITAVLIISTSLAAYPLSMGLHRSQLYMEEHIVEWFADWFIETDPYRSHTALGDIGELKLSDQIVLRLRPDSDKQTAWLLRDASYNRYFNGTWLARTSRFTPHTASGDGREWTLSNPPDGESQSMDIALKLRNGRGMLPIPLNSWQLARLPVGDMQTNDLGAVKVSDGPGLVDFRVDTHSNIDRDAPPTESDLSLPKQERATLQQLAIGLDLIGASPDQIVRKVRTFLLGQFHYSLDLLAPETGLSALETFLLRTRAGHCEYFATAAALLLRAGGIPSRYATGFSVSEYSMLEDAYVARRRHAHAWTLVYLDGRWQDFDTTPPDWLSFEEARASWWQGAGDLWSWLNYQFSRWRWREVTAEDSDNRGLWGLAGLLTAILFWRLLRRQQIHRHSRQAQVPDIIRPGAESPFYQILNALSTHAGTRPSGETVKIWLRRIGAWNMPNMREMVDQHQRWRFDPNGLPNTEQQHLSKTVAAWLNANESKTR